MAAELEPRSLRNFTGELDTEKMAMPLDSGMVADNIFKEMYKHMEELKMDMQNKVLFIKHTGDSLQQPHELTERFLLPSFKQVKNELMNMFQNDFNRWLETLHF